MKVFTTCVVSLCLYLQFVCYFYSSLSNINSINKGEDILNNGKNDISLVTVNCMKESNGE